jgi:hypothetical protein
VRIGVGLAHESPAVGRKDISRNALRKRLDIANDAAHAARRYAT